ncbi:MAG TPA: hypothetical protein VG435_20075 [Acidimicrobiales bacterium]|jgi:predicted amidophosphoribosyltransferase|nr:hypothetical protein [Acidimicrobiales bacterium]
MGIERYCPACGQRWAPGGYCPNRWCSRIGRAWSVTFAVDVHHGALRQAIFRYKYRGEKSLAPILAGLLVNHLETRTAWFEEFGLITAVPGFTGPGAHRDWDPVGTLLIELGRRLGPAWSVVPGLVTKTAETPGMAGRSWTERQAIAQGPLRRSLVAAPDLDLTGASVLLLDDVLTEGSTLIEVAAVLRRAGASDVAGLVLTRQPWTPDPPGRPGPPAVPGSAARSARPSRPGPTPGGSASGSRPGPIPPRRTPM